MAEPNPIQTEGISPNERHVPVMVYSLTTVARGEIIIKSSLRANIWIRTEAVPEFIHIWKAQVITFGGTSIHPETYHDYFIPTSQVLAYHTLPPSEEPLDYEATESIRKMEMVTVLVGTFRFSGKIRISSQISLVENLEMMKSSFISLYDAVISNPFLQGMGVIKIPLVLMRPNHIHLGLI
jgi:hypothetical protein